MWESLHSACYPIVMSDTEGEGEGGGEGHGTVFASAGGAGRR